MLPPPDRLGAGGRGLAGILGGLGGAITCLCCLSALGLIGLWAAFIPFVAFFSKSCFQNIHICIYCHLWLEYTYDLETRANGSDSILRNFQQIMFLLMICFVTLRFVKRQTST